jgi:hypothetical protein
MLTLCLDFDGVVNSYTSDWQGELALPDPPVPGAFEFILNALDGGWNVTIHSSRLQHHDAAEAMIRWLIHHGFPPARLANDAQSSDHRELDHVSPRDQLWDEFPTLGIREPCLRLSALKPAAFITLDDRALTFTGTWPDLDALRDFKPWHQK